MLFASQEVNNEGNADKTCDYVRNGLSQLNGREAEQRNTQQQNGDGDGLYKNTLRCTRYKNIQQ